MRTVLAALDASAAATPVLDTAIAMAGATGADVDAIHVADGPIELPTSVAARHDIGLRLLAGPVEATLLNALADPAVIAAVLGSRGTPGGRRPAGRSATHVVERTGKPVVVVPPDALGAEHLMRRLLVPLDGTEESARAVAESLAELIVVDVELVVMHVFTAYTLPRFLDRPTRDLRIWGDEFVARYLPKATRLELRTGSVAAGIGQVCRDEPIDLVVLSWSQHAWPNRSPVIGEVLSHSAIPVLLLPIRGLAESAE